jgi:hypothetical protein
MFTLRVVVPIVEHIGLLSLEVLRLVFVIGIVVHAVVWVWRFVSEALRLVIVLGVVHDAMRIRRGLHAVVACETIRCSRVGVVTYELVNIGCLYIGVVGLVEYVSANLVHIDRLV